MAKPSQSILDFMELYGVESDEIWEVHGSQWVIKHKALERVAAEKKITFDRPAVITCDVANKIGVVCVFGKLGDREEWSFGEASPANCKNAYPMAMCEKRAKDRVILKLLTSHGALYSESEADEFTQPQPRQNPHVTRPQDVFDPVEYDQNGMPVDNIPPPDPSSIKKLTVKDQRPIFEALQKEIHSTGSIDELTAWATTNKDRLGSLKPDWQEFLRSVYAEHLKAIRNLDQGDEMRMVG